ncbi:MAG TPA: hypothetical protein VLR92_06010, partial [Blastocatellia bacterium]|nr:hypothetical protein [Blastocatellia bacterium]
MSKALTAAITVLVGLGIAVAQLSPEKVAFTAPKIVEPLPFKIGETLTYDVSFSKLIFSGTIGELELSVSRPSEPAKA